MAYFLSVLVRMSILGSLLAVLLHLLRPVFQKHLSMTVFYYLWLLVLLRLSEPFGVMIPMPDAVKASFDHAGVYGLPEDTAGRNTSEQTAGAAGSSKQTGEAAADLSNENLIDRNLPNGNLIDSIRLNENLLNGNRSDNAAGTQQSQTGAADVFKAVVRFVLYSLSGTAAAGKYSAWWFALWGTGALFGIIWYIGSYLYFSGSVRRCAVKPAPAVKELLRGLDPSGRVQLLQSPLISSPLLLGVIHPVIVLPAGIEDQSRLKDIFIHELTHARRHDLIYKWFTAAAASIHWFNPVMIWIRMEIGRTCELACDEAVMRGMDADERHHYGQTLLAISAVPSGPDSAALSFCREKEQLKERLVFIVKYRKKGTAAALLSVLAAFAVGGCALVSGTDLSAAAGHLSYQGQDHEIGNNAPAKKSASKGQDDKIGDNMLLQESAEQQYMQDSSGMYEAFQAILQGKDDFLYVSSEDGTVKITEIMDVPKIFSPYSSYASIEQFALVDLDGDGVQEMVLQVVDVANDMGGYMILHNDQGEVYGFTSHYKTFENLKADGTFQYSTLLGTETGISSMTFTKAECVMERTAYQVTDIKWEKFSYFVDDKLVSAGQYESFINRQNKKQDAVWHKFTDQGILEVFCPDSLDTEKEGSDGQNPLLPKYENMDPMDLYTFIVRVSGGQELTVALCTEQPDKQYFQVDQILIYSGKKLLQTIDPQSIPDVEEYAWDGLFVNQGSAVGEPDIRDVNFDGEQDFGLLAVGTYPHNVPYSYFLWNEEKQCFDYGFTLFGAGALKVDAKHKRLVEKRHDVNGEYKDYYKYKPDGSIYRMQL